jgi:hypothetical protein
VEWSEHIKTLLRTLPERPGVYHHIDKDGVILYIGKAKNLKKRVGSYFQKNHESARLSMLVRKVADIKTIVTETEFDALLLENTLIKKHQPRYNINLKDGKTYPWICIKKERFPRIFATRRRIEDGSEYFGPYASVKMMYTMLDIIKEVFTLRTCQLPMEASAIESGKYRACLEFHIKRCLAPCEGLQDEASYLADVVGARLLLRGDLRSTRERLYGSIVAREGLGSFLCCSNKGQSHCPTCARVAWAFLGQLSARHCDQSRSRRSATLARAACLTGPKPRTSIGNWAIAIARPTLSSVIPSRSFSTSPSKAAMSARSLRRSTV